MADVSTAVVCLVCATGLVSLLQMKNKSSRCQKILPILSILLLLTGETVKIVLNFFSMYAFAKVAELHGMTSSGMLLAILHILQISKVHSDKYPPANETHPQ